MTVAVIGGGLLGWIRFPYCGLCSLTEAIPIVLDCSTLYRACGLYSMSYLYIVVYSIYIGL